MTYKVAHHQDGTLHGFGPADLYEPGGEGLIITFSANPPVIPESAPSSVTNAQGKAALILMGLDDDVEAFINAIPDPIERKLALNDYNNRLTWERANPRLQAIAATLNFDLDAMFTLAAQQ